MRNRLNRILALLLALAFLPGLSACSADKNLELRLDVTAGINNLDPQFTTDLLGCTILANTMEGLLRKDGAGNLVPAGAEDWKVSADGLLYTFALRRDARWSSDLPVTAQDYVFAFRRLFDYRVASPYAEEYMAIRGAAQVLAGELSSQGLGVRAADDYTLEIRLEKPSASFGERLAETAALPCNQEFFDSTRARYGLGVEYMIFNGPYLVRSWDNRKSIVLRPNGQYREPPACPGVVVYTSRITEERTALDLFAQGKNDVYPATAQELEKLGGAETVQVELKNRVWQLVFNTREGKVDDPALRRAMVLSLDRSGYRERVPQMYGIAQSLIPFSAGLPGMTGPSLLPYNPQEARGAAGAWLREGQPSPKLSLILPKQAELDLLGSYMLKQWFDNLSLYVNMEALPEAEFAKKLESGDFTIALQQIEAADHDPAAVLEVFSSVSIRNWSGWRDPDYDLLLEAAARAADSREAASFYSRAEQRIIDQAVAAPILTQSSYFVFGKGVSGVEMVNGQLDFRKAVRVG